jgi:hypothetical protein
MKIPVSFRTSYARADKQILVDSGATDNFIDPRLLKRLGLRSLRLERPRKIWNIDGTNNRAGMISDYVDLNVQSGNKGTKMRFLVTDLGLEDLILGYPWLAYFEPKFSWREGVIDTTHLPIIIRSLSWHQTTQTIVSSATVARIVTDPLNNQEKDQIVQELEKEYSSGRGMATQFAQDAQQYTQMVEIPPEYQRHAKVFDEEASNRFPPSRSWDHAIELKADAPKAIDCKVYPITPAEDEALLKFLKDMQQRGYIRPSKSPYASSFFFIRKKDGKLRPVQDYQKLNQWTIPNRYPLPLIPELIAQVKDAEIFSKFDVRQGYNNVCIKKGDEHKAAFKTKYGLFEPLVMFFGLKNSPSTFQAMMDQEFRDIIEEQRLLGTEIIIYMDDILVASTSLAGHRNAVHAILDRLEELDLYLKPEKCTWEAPRVDYLGLILEKGVTRMDPAKIKGIANWPTPTTVKQVRSFLGFCNFYRPFIYHFSHIARPLNELTRKENPWTWEERHQKAFEELRNRVTSEPVLAQPRLDQQFELEVDASGFAFGAVLSQKGEDGKRHPIAFYSATAIEAERNYDIYDLELLAIVKACRHWRPYLAGSPHKIIVHTDHANLQYWRQPHKISRRIAREVLELSEFDIELHHIPGKSNGRADALSRRPDYDQGERDNENIVVLPDKLFIQSGTTTFEPPHSVQDEDTLQPWVDPHQLKKINGEWWKGQRKVITGNAEVRRNIIKNHHDLPTYGHPGISRTTDLVAKYHWWPNLANEVQNYVKGCAECQRHKINTQARKAPLSPITPVREALPFQTIALDFIVKLPISNGYDSILTITDHDCSKAAIFIPCKETINAEGVAELYLRYVFPRYGLPTKIISDRDPRFTSKFMKELLHLIGATTNTSTAYHPRTDGQSERSNQFLGQFLRPWVNAQQDNWEPYLPIAEFAHNAWRNETTRQTPFSILMGYEPKADISNVPTSIPMLELRREVWKRAREDAHKFILQAQARWAQSKKEGRTFKEGDRVWLEGRNLHLDQPSAKLAPKRHGPFIIKRVLSPITYQLTLPHQWKIHDVFHVDLLTPYIETDFHGPNYTRPPPDLIDGEEEYEVESILKSRRYGQGRKVQYLVKWKGYTDSDNEWVNWDDMHADEALAEFKRRQPHAITHIRRAANETESTTHQMTTDAFCAALPYAELEGPIPYDGPSIAATYNDPDASATVGSSYSPAQTRRHAAWVRAWKELNCQVPSSWRTPSPTPPQSPTPPPYLDVRYSFKVQQNLIDPMHVLRTTLARSSGGPPTIPIRSRTPSPHSSDDSSEDLSSQPFYITNTVPATATDPLTIPIPRTESISPIPTRPRLDDLGGVLDHTRGLRQDPLGAGEDGQEAEEIPSNAGTAEGRGRVDADPDTVPGQEADSERLLQVSGTWTPAPEGYAYNLGAQFVPMPIRGPDGRIWPARFTKVEFSDDPTVHGFRAGSPTPYSDHLYATPFFDLRQRPRYAVADMWFLSTRYPYRDEVDLGLKALGDLTVQAEVRRYRGHEYHLNRLQNELTELENRIGTRQMEKDQCIRRLEQADALQRIHEANNRNISGARVRVVELLTDLERGRSS